MRTSSAKAKGRRCATETKNLILKYNAGLEPDDVIVTSSGETGEDVKLSPRARGRFPFSIECKNVERLNIWKAIEQAEGHSENYLPVVFIKRNRSKTYVVVEADEFMQLVQYKYGYGGTPK